MSCPALSTVYSRTYLYMLCVGRQRRGPNRAIYLYDNHDRINQGHVFIFVLQFELTSFSDGPLSKGSDRPTVFNWEKY